MEAFLQEILTEGVDLWYNPIVLEARRQGKVLRSGEFQRAAGLLKTPYSLPQEKHPRAAEANGERPE